MPGPARARLPSDRALGGGGRLPAGVHQPHLRQPPRPAAADRRCPRRSWRSPRARGCRVWIPDDVAGHCCATPWSSKGYRRGHDHMAARTAAALWRWSARRRAARRDRRDLLRPRAARGRRPPPRRRRARALRADRGARLDRLGARPAAAAAADDAQGGRRPRSIRPARPARWASTAKLEAIAGELADEVRDPRRRELLRDGRRPRPAAPRAAGLGAARRGRGPAPSIRSTSTCRSNRTCEIGAAADHRALRTRRSCCCSSGSRGRASRARHAGSRARAARSPREASPTTRRHRPRRAPPVTPSASTTPRALRQSSPTTNSHTPARNASTRLMRPSPARRPWPPRPGRPAGAAPGRARRAPAPAPPARPAR